MSRKRTGLDIGKFLWVAGMWAPVACTGALNDPSSNASGSNSNSGLAPNGSGSVPNAADDAELGRVTMRRLTLTEYENTIRDLLGQDVSPLLSNFPSDGRTEGFDNNGDSLGIAPNQLSVFERAAETLAAEMLEPGRVAQQRYFPCLELADPGCQRQVLATFAAAAWRRPVSQEELDGLAALGSESLELALRGVLLAPQFLFRVEFDPNPESGLPFALGDYEVASRLSYFLWSSMPDAELFTAAAAGGLHDVNELGAQITRMLEDPRASALTTNFARQWLGMYKLVDHNVDAQTFPAYDSALTTQMAAETEGLFGHVLSSDLPLSELLTANYGFVDARLAQHYGAPDPSQAPAPTAFGDLPRGGLLSQAAILTLTSYPNRTSVVRRGVWVLENLLCEVPPPPPEGVDTSPPPVIEGTLRQRMEAHRADPACAGCHTLMDPIGLGLENFDAIGQWRDTENDVVIDPSGELVGSGSFSGPRELAQRIANDQRLDRCLTKKLLTFALGRTLTKADEPYIDGIKAAVGETRSLRDFVANVALSDVLRTQGGDR